PRAGDRARAEPVPARRAALEPRRQAQAPGAPRAEEAAPAHRHYDDLRDPRPRRGDGPRRARGGHEARHGRADRPAHRQPPRAGEHLRRAVHGLAGDEPDPPGRRGPRLPPRELPARQRAVPARPRRAEAAVRRLRRRGPGRRHAPLRRGPGRRHHADGRGQGGHLEAPGAALRRARGRRAARVLRAQQGREAVRPHDRAAHRRPGGGVSVQAPAAAERARARAERDYARREAMLAIGMLAPAVVFILLLVGVPFGLAIYYSLHDVTTGGTEVRWVGLRHFAELVRDRVFLRSLSNTLLFTATTLVAVLVLSTVLAELLM